MTLSAWAEDFAASVGLELRLEAPLPGGVPAYKYDGPEGPVVVLDATLPAERLHFTLAHEAAHVLLDHAGEVEPSEEFEANRLASELLLPEREFRPHAHRTLRELKELFPHASFEVLARRRLAFTPGVLTVVDNGELTRRLASDGFAHPPLPAEPEWRVIREAYTRAADLEREIHGLRLAATHVDTGRGVARVLLLVEEA